MEKKSNKDKKQLKTEPNLGVQLTEEQKKVVELFYQHDVNFIVGDFGSGKTLTAVHTGVKAFRKKQFNKIWIARPMLKNQLAALPGTIEEKMAPYVFPILQNINQCQPKDITERMIENDYIEIIPIEVAKGITYIDSVVIVDEFQDMDYQDFRTMLTRLGKDSKIFFCGSKQQIDSKIGANSCFHRVEKLKDSGLVGYTELTSNHRNDCLVKIIKYLEEDK
jgi:phosphate starvation-inducible PhoH-like protein